MPTDTHAVVPMDRAGWHVAKDLAVPANLTPLFLPPYSPELNAIERVFLHPRRLLHGLERPARRNRPHPLPLRPRLGHDGQFLMALVLYETV